MIISLIFKTAKLLKLGVNYSCYHMAHAEFDTCSRPSLNHWHCGQLKRTSWQHAVLEST